MWDDYHPYVFETSDFGNHWVPLTAGIPDNQYVFVVRQDPLAPRLLFAGTRSTAYVSLDSGQDWQPLTMNLPGVQVRDLAIDSREGELVAATHGRAFWILDNLAYLEQLAGKTSFSVASLQLFSPQTAWLSNAYGGSDSAIPDFGDNPKYGAAVFFNVPAAYHGESPLTISFLDSNGATIRSFALHPKNAHAQKLTPEQEENLDVVARRARDLEKLTTVKPGPNLFQWDLRYEPAYEVPGVRALETDDFPDTADGPTIVPGAYTVVLRYGAQTLQAPFKVVLDPRIHSSTGDLEARLALEMQIRSSIDTLDRSIVAAMTVRKKMSAAQAAALNSEIADLVLLDVHSSEADVMHTTEVREQLGFLLNSLEGAYQRPTVAEYATYKDLAALAEAGEARLKELNQ
jgi:hypothetical protein